MAQVHDEEVTQLRQRAERHRGANGRLGQQRGGNAVDLMDKAGLNDRNEFIRSIYSHKLERIHYSHLLSIVTFRTEGKMRG